MNQTGGYCALFVGAAYIAYVVVYLRDPCRRSTNAHQFMTLYRQESRLYLLRSLIMALASTAALAVVPAVLLHLGTESGSWTQWTGTLALVGFAASAISYFRTLQIMPVIFRDWNAADENTKVALARSSSLIALDPRGWFEYGGVGLWLLAVDLAALRSGALPPAVAFAGMAAGGFFFLALVGGLLHRYQWFPVVAAAGGLVAAPVWYISVGVILLGGGGAHG